MIFSAFENRLRAGLV